MTVYIRSLITVLSYFCVFFVLIIVLSDHRLIFFLALLFGIAVIAWLFREEPAR